MLGFKKEEILAVSSKTSEGIEDIFEAIISRIPSPIVNSNKSPRILLYDSFWDVHRGVVCLVYVESGSLRTGDTVGKCICFIF